jgi:hypothetical protein
LWKNVSFFREGVERLGYQTLGTSTPIIPLFVGSEALAFRLCREALDMGVFVTPAIYPAVPMGHALIRTSVNPAHTREHLRAALGILATLASRHPLPQQDARTIPVARSMDLAELTHSHSAPVDGQIELAGALAIQDPGTASL